MTVAGILLVRALPVRSAALLRTAGSGLLAAAAATAAGLTVGRALPSTGTAAAAAGVLAVGVAAVLAAAGVLALIARDEAGSVLRSLRR